MKFKELYNQVKEKIPKRDIDKDLIKTALSIDTISFVFFYMINKAISISQEISVMVLIVLLIMHLYVILRYVYRFMKIKKENLELQKNNKKKKKIIEKSMKYKEGAIFFMIVSSIVIIGIIVLIIKISFF